MIRLGLIHILLFFLFTPFIILGQVSFTANDVVTPYDKHFRYGANMGYYPPWQDYQLAEIAAGDSRLKLPGIGVNALRPALFEHFFEQWGYEARRLAFDRYAALGMTENVGFIGYPSEQHRDKTNYCPERAGWESAIFKNLYTPIWDNGEHGTPVNDENFYALYVYKIVNQYKDQVRFWEVWNEPDFDFASDAWKDAGIPGNWWENMPSPCSYALKAPAYHYIRLLRISYEVIKSIDKDLYVCTGGLGYPSFLDVILRNTDNPEGGKTTAAYPLKGGAYFDVLSFHSYPHIDGSVRKWNNEKWEFEYNRHSDAAVKGFVNRKKKFEEVLEGYGYNDKVFPKKEWICTETTLPRLKKEDFMGSEKAQINYILKSLVVAQREGLHQYHIYTMADAKKEADATDPYDLMGLFYALQGTQPYSHKPTVAGIAYKSISDFLYKWKYDAKMTSQLALPKTIDGAAFVNRKGAYRFVLWAKTKEDENENVTVRWKVPEGFPYSVLNQSEWDYSKKSSVKKVSTKIIELTSTPRFFQATTSTSASTSTPAVAEYLPYIQVTKDRQLRLILPKTGLISIKILNKYAQQVFSLTDKQPFKIGSHLLPNSNQQKGTYLAFIELDGKKTRQRVVVP